MENYEFILVDYPAPKIKRITLNRPEKRNAMNNKLRGEVFDALQKADENNEIHVTIIKGGGSCFSSGYDLMQDFSKDLPYFTPPGGGVANWHWPPHVTYLWSMIGDLAKPVIAQVHGFCLAGATEFVSGCDLVYVAEDAQIGFPAVRSISPPDYQFPVWLMGLRGAMEFMLTGSSMSGKEAVRVGYANRAFPLEELEEKTLEMAIKVSKIPSDLQVLNKRSVWQAMEIMGMKKGIRAGHILQTLAGYQRSNREFMKNLYTRGTKEAFSERDGKWGDYRTTKKEKDN